MSSSSYIVLLYVTISYHVLPYIIIIRYNNSLNPWWISITIFTYTSIYAIILYNSIIEMMILQSQINKLSTIPHIDVTICESITDPLYQRYHHFQFFLFLVLLLIIIEITCQILYVVNTTPFIIIILLYELVSLFVMLAFAYMFRPTVDLSPFYFMVPTSLEGESSSSWSSSSSYNRHHHNHHHSMFAFFSVTNYKWK